MLLDVTRESQRPTRLHLPLEAVASSGPDVIEFAASAGLFLDDWQCWVLEHALSERADHKWSAFECCLIVPRQNGKGSILEALELYHLFVLRTGLVVHSAHEFKTAREHFLRMQALIQNAPELNEQVNSGDGYIHTGAGAESIHPDQGGRLNFIARSKGSGRGFSGDLIVLDEAFNLPVQAVGAMAFTLSAMPNPQVWYTSSAPHADSYVLHGVRNRGMEGLDPRLFHAEWGNDLEPDADREALIDDDDAMARVNPGYPHRLTDDNLQAERRMLTGMDAEILRERFGVPEASEVGSGVFDPGEWQAGLDKESKIAAAPTIALDVGFGMEYASFGAGGTRSDGLAHGELIERQPGTGWVVARAKELTGKYGKIRVAKTGPVKGLFKELEEAGVELDYATEEEVAVACATLQRAVKAGTFRHLGQAPLDSAVAGAAITPSGDSWRFSRSRSVVDISPLVAVTLAAARMAPAQVTAIVI